MNRTALFLCGALCGAAAAIGTVAIAESEMDPLKLSPQLYTGRIDNAHLRAYEYRIKPGAKDPMHAHPTGLLVYVMAGGHLKITAADGTVADVPLKRGDLFWRDPVNHAVENVGKTEVHALLVEPKPCNGTGGS